MKIEAFRCATTTDAAIITKLVNNAYRPEPNKSGWTHESDLVLGDRTNTDQIIEIILKPDSIILVGLCGDLIVGCVHVQKDHHNSYIGMLAVDPTLQGLGTGKKILTYAEKYATDHFHAEKFVMVVVSDRHELISFYERRGYQKTGEVMEYPLSAGVGTPKQLNLKIEVLEKLNL
jgi:ribosomal protein S18 acetylase RimI-like enzyme